MTDDQKTIAEAVREFDSDVVFYNGPIERPHDEKFIDVIHDNKQKEKILLILVTSGGDPHAAYRMARYLQESYDHITVFVSGSCKSAGTLIAIGAHELVFSRHGELGPLDVQMAKKDEIWVHHSGLIINAALEAVEEKAFAAFENFLLKMRVRSGTITTRTASEISTNLVTGLFSKIYESIDPFHIGEAARSIAIAERYGNILIKKSKIFKNDDDLSKLITDYPDHGFVIDREEAKELFDNVRHPNENEQFFLEPFNFISRQPFPYNPFQYHYGQFRNKVDELTDDGESNEQSDETQTQEKTTTEHSGSGTKTTQKSGRSSKKATKNV